MGKEHGRAETGGTASEVAGVSQANEDLFKLVVGSVRDYAVFATDTAGRILGWNPGVLHLLGYEEQEWVGRHASVIFTPEDRERGDDVREMETAAREGRTADERWHVRRDGTRFWADGLLMALRDADGALRGFAKILRDNTAAREQAERLLESERATRREAEEANRLKDEFLATLSHELRTPLTAILGWSRLLRGGGVGAEATERALESIERNAVAQRQLIDDILDVSRIISGKLRLDVRPVSVVSIIEAAVDAVRPAAEAKGVELSVEIGARTGALSADPARLQQVVWNLLSNAVKFTPAGGRVEVRAERSDDEVRIRVSDTGRGIAPDFLPYVFDRSRQADASTTRQQGGLGLGLSIVRHLVELHGGAVVAESEGEGRGATFTVTLPAAARPPAPAAPATADATRSDRAEECPPSLEGLHILVLDDEGDTREVVAAILGKCGAHVLGAASAPEALDALGDGAFDLILSDIGMPGVDGYEFIRRVRARERESGARPIPAIALTAYAHEEDRLKAFRAGFQMHITKPVEPGELVAVVASFSGRTQEQGGGGR
jgi:PAS domain S-box-containing protein